MIGGHLPLHADKTGFSFEGPVASSGNASSWRPSGTHNEAEASAMHVLQFVCVVRCGLLRVLVAAGPRDGWRDCTLVPRATAL